MRGVWRNLSGPQRTVVQTVSVVVFMGGMGFASVPLYDLFCRVTGYGGTTQVASGESDVVLDETVRVRFDASKDRGFPWEFRPVERTMEVRLGETNLAFYEAYNPTDRPIAGIASFNVTPFAAGVHFAKIQCFCFEFQVLQPGERVQMPVSFFVDPAMLDDPDAYNIRQITLSYTFYETDLTDDVAALDTPAPANLAQ
jgi:cytochrome c oxidase assembly protein subunit 11